MPKFFDMYINGLSSSGRRELDALFNCGVTTGSITVFDPITKAKYIKPASVPFNVLVQGAEIRNALLQIAFGADISMTADVAVTPAYYIKKKLLLYDQKSLSDMDGSSIESLGYQIIEKAN